MRRILRSPAPILLLILAIPLVFIAFTAAAGSQPRATWTLFQVASIVCLLIGFAVALVGVRLGSAVRRMPLDERMVEIHVAIVLMGIYFTIDAFALLLAIASPAIGLFISAIGAAWIVLWLPPRFRKVIVSSSYVVNRSPDVVFAFVGDPRNEAKYQPDLESVEMITNGPVGPGSQFRYRLRLSQQLAEGVEEIVDYEPNHRLTTRVTTGLHPNLAELTFEPVEGGTRVAHRFEFERGISSALMGGWMRQPATDRIVLARRRAGEARIKQILESAPL
jgi:carbon monoxide dehydrogenase subunit G